MPFALIVTHAAKEFIQYHLGFAVPRCILHFFILIAASKAAGQTTMTSVTLVQNQEATLFLLAIIRPNSLF
jgi:hypothetical protein